MSSGLGPVTGDGASHSLLPANVDVSRPGTLVPLSADDWERLEEPVRERFDNHGWTASMIERWIRSKDRQTSYVFAGLLRCSIMRT